MPLRVLAMSMALLTLGFHPSHAATQAQIDLAVQRGVKHLLGTQAADGGWEFPGCPEGATAVAGLAVLESGAKPKDPAMERAAQYLRSRAAACRQTYSLSLMIFFFDRLGDRRDEALLKALGERLRDGQCTNGSWSYTCGPGTTASGDNSNTQFAILGLWVARRHGADVKTALEKTDGYFRSTQGKDGGWNYTAVSAEYANQFRVGNQQVLPTSTGPMTCAGLLGLLVQMGNQAALRAGQVKDLSSKPSAKAAEAAPKPLQDPMVQAGLKCLERFLLPQTNTVAQVTGGSELYFLWSLERVGMAYGLKKIGPVDWYAVGADRILASQLPDGSWTDYSPSVGTSLALLFLKRANVASDLTRFVEGRNELRSGSDLDELRNATAAPATPRDKLSSAEIAGASPEQLTAALRTANGKQQAAILAELRDRKGVEATQALAEAVDLLEDPLAGQARDFLAQRLGRMTPATLARYLEVDDLAIRRAAAQAAASKQDRGLIKPLLDRLEDRDAATADAAHAALVKITSQQLDAFAGESTANRFVVIKKWRAWWRAQETSPKKP